MYVGRDLSQLGMMSKDQWKDTELAYFHPTVQRLNTTRLLKCQFPNFLV